MAIAFGTAGSVATGTTSLSCAYPISIAAGDLLLLPVVTKYPANPPTTPAGWTLLTDASVSGGHGASGVDTGSVLVNVYYKVADGSESGSLTVTITGGNSAQGYILRFTKTGTNPWGVAATNGAMNTPSTSWSVTMASDIGLVSGDYVFIGSGFNSDTGGASLEAMTASGATVGTLTERGDGGSALGDDMRIFGAEGAITAGTSNAPAVYTATISQLTGVDAPAGGSVLIRMRDLTPASGAAAITLDTATVAATGTVTVQGAFAKTLAGDTSAATGTVTVQGAFAKTLAGDTSAATGSVLAQGALAKTLAGDTAAATGTVADTVVAGPSSVGLSGFIAVSGWTDWLAE